MEGRSVHSSAAPKALAPLIDWMSLDGVFQPIEAVDGTPVVDVKPALANTADA